jgi:tripeptide aminopeptidase
LPADAPSSLTVARAGGGISINAIPAEAWFEVDVRSEAPVALPPLEHAVRSAASVAIARGGGGKGSLTLEITVIGDRPAGAVAADAFLVRAAAAATAHVGESPELVASSTDANVPLALGVPAIAIGGGGESGGTHTTAEWYRDVGSAQGIERALLTVLLACRYSPPSTSE